MTAESTGAADALLFAEVVGKVLRNAASPSQAGREITHELRGLTGAQTALLLECLHEHGGEGHPVVAVSPARRQGMAQSPEMEALAELADELAEPTIWRLQEEGGEAQRLLRRLGVRDTIVAPLTVGSKRVGCLMLLSIPGDSHGVELVLNTLDMLSTTLALVFRNAMLYERQEATIAKRSRELIASNKALRESEDHLRSVLRAAPVGIGVVVDGVFTQANQHLCRMTGYREEELIGLDAETLLPGPAEPAKATRRTSHLARDPDAGSAEARWRKKDGSTIDVLLNSSPIDLTDPSKGLTVTALDVTERKKMEEERLTLERQVLHAQKLESLGVLAGGIAHDFNNILAAILGNAGLALSDLPAGAPVRGQLEEIEKASRRAAELAKQMLAYSGKGRFVVEPIDLGKLTEEMAQLLEVSISKKAVLTCQCPEDLPAFDGDVTQIRQIIMNLITNASEALGDDSGVIALSTGVMHCDRAYLNENGRRLQGALGEPLPEGAYVYLQVADTGCGMDEATRTKVFDPFFTTKFAGRGLGLAAVLGIVRGHRGSIRIDSQPGEGTTVRLLFPVSHTPPPTKEPPPASAGTWRGSKTVLLVEDEAAVRQVGTSMLRRLGLSVIEAADGREAVDIFRSRADGIDCVILDLTMPRMGGEETCRQLRQIRPELPVILCSGYDERDVAERFLGEGVSGVVQKPYDLNHLSAALRDAFGAPAAAGR